MPHSQLSGFEAACYIVDAYISGTIVMTLLCLFFAGLFFKADYSDNCRNARICAYCTFGFAFCSLFTKMIAGPLLQYIHRSARFYFFDDYVCIQVTTSLSHGPDLLVQIRSSRPSQTHWISYSPSCESCSPISASHSTPRRQTSR